MGAVGGAISAVSDVASEVAGTSVERVGQLVPASLLGTPVPSGYLVDKYVRLSKASWSELTTDRNPILICVQQY
eukprot:1544142-Amphidinium_carterae.1